MNAFSCVTERASQKIFGKPILASQWPKWFFALTKSFHFQLGERYFNIVCLSEEFPILFSLGEKQANKSAGRMKILHTKYHFSV